MMSQHTGGMPCPVCRVDLVMSERNGVEIDYCPRCRGVWLDRGELDKILERSTTFTERHPAGYSREHSSGHDRDGDHDRDWDARYPYDPRKRRRRSFLDDIFDFD